MPGMPAQDRRLTCDIRKCEGDDIKKTVYQFKAESLQREKVRVLSPLKPQFFCIGCCKGSNSSVTCLLIVSFIFFGCVNCEGKSALVERKPGGEQTNFRWFLLSGNILVLH